MRIREKEKSKKVEVTSDKASSRRGGVNKWRKRMKIRYAIKKAEKDKHEREMVDKAESDPKGEKKCVISKEGNIERKRTDL